MSKTLKVLIGAFIFGCITFTVILKDITQHHYVLFNVTFLVVVALFIGMIRIDDQTAKEEEEIIRNLEKTIRKEMAEENKSLDTELREMRRRRRRGI